MKQTWLWLKNLPNLVHNGQDGLFDKKTHTKKPKPYKFTKTGKPVYFMDNAKLGHSGKEWGKIRSKFWPGIANAMADQWG